MEKPFYCARPEFRAPPPSPMGFGSDSAENNEDELIGYLQRTVRIPTLNLPDKIVPHKKAPTWNPPEIDLRFLNSNENEGTTNVEVLKTAAAKYGCFQIVNHGINMKMVETVLEMAFNRIFRVSSGKKTEMKGEKVWRFELEREEGEEGEEVLWWGKDKREAEDSEDIFSHEYIEFCAKMENLQSQMEEIGSNIAQILQQDSTVSTSTEEKRNDRSFICLHTHNAGLEKAKDSLINHEVLRMLVRDTKVSRALSLHLCKYVSEFRVYSKMGQSSFGPLNDAIIVTIGNQIQDWSRGLYKNVIGKPVCTKTDSTNSVSIEFLYSHSRNRTRITPQSRESEIFISTFHQFIIITTCLTLIDHLMISLLYIS